MGYDYRQDEHSANRVRGRARDRTLRSSTYPERDYVFRGVTSGAVLYWIPADWLGARPLGRSVGNSGTRRLGISAGFDVSAFIIFVYRKSDWQRIQPSFGAPG